MPPAFNTSTTSHPAPSGFFSAAALHSVTTGSFCPAASFEPRRALLKSLMLYAIFRTS
jgi:hypothetical protein